MKIILITVLFFHSHLNSQDSVYQMYKDGDINSALQYYNTLLEMENEESREENGQTTESHISEQTAEQVLEGVDESNTEDEPPQLVHETQFVLVPEIDRTELTPEDRERIVQLIQQRINSASQNSVMQNMYNGISEDGFSDMDMDEAIRRSLE